MSESIESEPRYRLSTTWCRFSEYRISNDFIVPAENAKLDFYHLGDETSQGLSQDSVLTLAADLRAASTLPLFASDQKSQDLVLKFCSRHGLLGLFAHDVHMIGLAPRWQRSGQDPRSQWLAKTQRRYVRRGASWATEVVQLPTPLRRPYPGMANYERPYVPELEDQLVEHLAQDELFLGPCLQVYDGARVDEKSLAAYANSYFPTIEESELETFPYPEPCTPEFWKQYAEPFDEFVRAVLRFERIVNNKPRTSERSHSAALFRQDKLNVLINGVFLSFQDTGRNKRAQMVWHVPSLLGLFALSAAQEFTSARVIANCIACQKPIFSDKYQKRYCSKKCRSLIQKRKQREKKRKL